MSVSKLSKAMFVLIGGCMISGVVLAKGSGSGSDVSADMSRIVRLQAVAVATLFSENVATHLMRQAPK